jgi:hypothetical protein
MAPLSTENSVKAKCHNQPAFDEGAALETLEPGQGVVRGSGGFEAAGADSPTTRVVREQRNPGSRGIEDNESPLAKTYASGENVETLGFQSHDQARLLFAYSDNANDGTDDTYSEGDEVGWNANGYLEHVDASGSSVTEAVGRIAEEDDFTMSSGDGPRHTLVEFY